jgi:hypothetical protein
MKRKFQGMMPIPNTLKCTFCKAVRGKKAEIEHLATANEFCELMPL